MAVAVFEIVLNYPVNNTASSYVAGDIHRVIEGKEDLLFLDGNYSFKHNVSKSKVFAWLFVTNAPNSLNELELPERLFSNKKKVHRVRRKRQFSVDVDQLPMIIHTAKQATIPWNELKEIMKKKEVKSNRRPSDDVRVKLKDTDLS